MVIVFFQNINDIDHSRMKMYSDFVQLTVRHQYLHRPNRTQPFQTRPGLESVNRPAPSICISPTVFSVTVFPPVFGPVITIVVMSFPNSMLFATASSTGNKWMSACESRIYPSLFTSGFVYLFTVPYFAFARMTSISER